VSDTPAKPSQTFPRKLRLLTQADFDRVYRTKVFAADDVLVINAGASEMSHARLGLSVSKKVGNAVTRNRWKRLIREAFRLSQHELPAGIDLVARPQKGAIAELEAIRHSLLALARRVAKRAAHRPSAPDLRPPIGGERGTSAP
jgi:ribonuclease P protein component